MTPPTLTVDAHHHFWRTARQPQPWRTSHHAALAHDFEPADLEPSLKDSGIDATVLIQSVDLPEENERMLRYAAGARWVRGVVAWLPLHDPPTARALLAGLRTHPLIRGARCLIGRDDADWLTAPATLALFRELAAADLTWDIVPVTEAQARQVASVAEAVPQLRIIIDHMGRPPLDASADDDPDAWRPWQDRIAALGRLPNLALKLSVGIDVLTAWHTWSSAALHHPTAHALHHFGADRLMLASNWPVITLHRSHRTVWNDLYEAARHALPADDRALAALRGGTAMRWYGLKP
ncbi:amidohydrolase family protein [Streptomyces avermitilis]|uniref:amidohydrolase family protein n=1 Tax=Streptomyces avermitilis TaxID=33903 RepID=UPI0033BDAAD5